MILDHLSPYYFSLFDLKFYSQLQWTGNYWWYTHPILHHSKNVQNWFNLAWKQSESTKRWNQMHGLGFILPKGVRNKVLEGPELAFKAESSSQLLQHPREVHPLWGVWKSPQDWDSLASLVHDEKRFQFISWHFWLILSHSNRK